MAHDFYRRAGRDVNFFSAAHVLLAKPSLFAEGNRQGHFFGFVFFTADFLAPSWKARPRLRLRYGLRIHVELRKSPREARSRTLTFLAAGLSLKES
jgi:hypothetical protein